MKSKKIQNRVKLGLIQMSAGDDPDANLGRTVERIRTAAKRGAKIVCLQELFRSRYFCQSEDQKNFKLAETIPGAT
ncbi:MAG: acyltransferase, partial [Deltaproteobacteria bacterium]|nr:acyltransferase [Deltaproteobacteria bacterium]